MINIKLVKRKGLTESEIVKLLSKARVEAPSVFLFPEYTFRNKFRSDEIEKLARELPLENGINAFFSAYRLERDEEARERMERHMKSSGWDRGYYDSPTVRKFFSPKCINTGYLVSGNGGENNIFSYQKRICASLDSLNGDPESRVVNLGGREYKQRGVSYDNEDFSQEEVSFPILSVNDKSLEFRVCADIGCGSKNDADVVLISAHGLFDVEKEFIKFNNDGKIFIVNDSGRFFHPVGYKDGETYWFHRKLSETYREKGIKVGSVG